MHRVVVILSCTACLPGGCSESKSVPDAVSVRDAATGRVAPPIVGPLGLHDVETVRGNGFQIDVPRSWQRDSRSAVERLRATGRVEKEGPPYQSWSGDILVQHTPLSSVLTLDKVADHALRDMRLKVFAERKHLKLANGAEALLVSWDVTMPAESQTRAVKYLMWVKIKTGGRWHVVGTLQATGDEAFVARDGAADRAMKRCITSLSF